MEAGRTRWTDERIDGIAVALREEMRDFRLEMREGLREVRADIRELRTEIGGARTDTDTAFHAVYAQLGLERRWLAGLWVTTLLGFAGLIVQLSLR
jgi:hypothetical protein